MPVEPGGELRPAVRAKAALLRQRAAGGSMWIRVDGNSMGRSIVGGAEVLVTSAKRPHVGEIWAFCTADGLLVVHRYRRKTRDGRLFQGDATRESDEAVRDDQLIGRVDAVRVGGGGGQVRRLGARERIRWWWRRARRWRARRASGVDGGAVGGEVRAADGDPVDEQGGKGLTSHDAGAVVRDSGIGHSAASMDRDRGAMVTADAVLDRCTVDLLGLPMQLEAVEPRGAEAIAAVLGGASMTDEVPAVRLRVAVSAPSTPSSPPDLSTPEFDTWRPVLGEVVVRHRSGLTARATSTTIDIGGDPAQFDAHFRRVCLTVLAHLLAQHDRFVVHGAAMVTGGRAVLVLGGTGAGKSTLVYCALLAHWEVLADDLVVLRSSDSGPTVGGVPRLLAVPSDVLDGSGLDTAPLVGDRRGRRELPSGVIAAGSYPVAGSIVVKHAAEAGGAIGPIGGHELLHDLLGSWAPIESPDDLARILPIAAAVARGNASTLCLGREPATRVVDTIRLLDDVRAQFGLT